MNKKYVQGIMAASLLISCSGAFAAGAWATGKITKTMVHTDPNEGYGKCMVLLSPEFDRTNLRCNESPWITLDCTGHFNSKEDARRMWDSAQLAFALDLKVTIRVVDHQMINEQCVAKRLDVLK
jgi:hypothetical protein